MGTRTLPTLAALAALAWLPSIAWAGQPGFGGASPAIASKICAQIQHDLHPAGFKRAFGDLRTCQQEAEKNAHAAVRSCLPKNQPGTAGWRRCIDSHVASAAKSLEAKRR